MRADTVHNGFAIALAWPATYCKQPGAWYDPLMRLLGFNRAFYYRAGHAALVLVEKRNGKCHYFDFGRYHAPFAHGRVRSELTDHELKIGTLAIISSDQERITNLYDVINELQANESCHGIGTLFAAYTGINFDAAMRKALSMQQSSPISYGPFVTGGTNCSRFVRTVILSGNPALKHRLALSVLLPVTPTPMSNVRALHGFTKYEMMHSNAALIRPYLNSSHLLMTLPPPIKKAGVPENAKWLSGEGAGSWFDCAFDGNMVHMRRYAPDGTLECSGFFTNNALSLELDVGRNADFEVVHPSHCQRLALKVNGRVWVLHRTEGEAGHDFIHQKAFQFST